MHAKFLALLGFFYSFSIVLIGGIVYFEDFDIEYEKNYLGYNIKCSKMMEINNPGYCYSSTHLLGCSETQSFTVDGHWLSLNYLRKIEAKQRTEIHNYQAKFSWRNEDIISSINALGSNLERKLMIMGLQKSGALDVETFLAVLRIFKDNLLPGATYNAPILAMFEDLNIKDKNESRKVLDEIFNNQVYSDSQVIRIFKSFIRKTDTLESWEQKIFYKHIASDSSCLEFIRISLSNNNFFLVDPLFYVRSISSDSSIVKAIELLDGKAPSSDVAKSLMSKISSDYSLVKAIGLFYDTPISAYDLKQMISNISSDSSIVSALKVVSLREKSSDFIMSVMRNISSDSSKVAATKILSSKINSLDSALSILNDISSDSSTCEAVKWLFGRGQIGFKGSDIKRISRTVSSSSSSNDIMTFLLDRL